MADAPRRACVLSLVLLLLVLLLPLLQNSVCTALLLQCPLHQMHLQKIVGFRPPLQYLKARNLIYAPSAQHLYAPAAAATLPPRQWPPANGNDNDTSAEEMLPSQSCWRLCALDSACIAYVHLLDKDECYGFAHVERTPHLLTIVGSDSLPLIADAEAIFYEKTCLNVPATCRGQLWKLTRIPGTSLVFQGRKTIAHLVTRRKCAEHCLFEREFPCLSASFAPSYRSNRERFATSAPARPPVVLGRCTLSDKDKLIRPDSFRAAPYDEEYMENQCQQRPEEPVHCAYELYANSSFVYAEMKALGLTQKECQERCTQERRFYCQGVSYHYDAAQPALRNAECALHSEDIISLGPRSLRQRAHSVYMRRVKCLDVQVLCTRNELAVKYTPKDWFGGRLYVSQHAQHCTADGSGNQSTLLRLPIGSELLESRCGVLRAYEVTSGYRRTFISALIVIQHNARVQTQGDRLIKVGCIASNVSEAVGDDDFMPNAIALESSLEFTQHSLPNGGGGSLHYNISDAGAGYAPPKVSLQIIDLSRQHETNDVHIGQNLELQIVAEHNNATGGDRLLLPPLPALYATSLVARTENSDNYVLLIDGRGCAIDANVFPAFERVVTPTQHMLRARFHAFKFAGTSAVNFDVKIQFCRRQRCPEPNCIPYGSGGGDGGSGEADAQWQQRRRDRRQLFNDDGAQQRPTPFNPVYISAVMDVLPAAGTNESASYSWPPPNATTTAAHLEPDDELPLNYNLNVRGPDSRSSNSFVYGERGILLIAGIDDQLRLDNFCLNPSLLIAVLIFWLIFQVAVLFGCCYIIQKYKRLASLDEERRKIHESLEYMEARRVHWADQGGFTL